MVGSAKFCGDTERDEGECGDGVQGFCEPQGAWDAAARWITEEAEALVMLGVEGGVDEIEAEGPEQDA